MSAGANKGAEGLRWFVKTQTMDINSYIGCMVSPQTMDILLITCW